MTMLHIINKSPFERRSLDACLNRARNGEGVLFIEDGIYATVKNTIISKKVTDKGEKLALYVLGPDVAARGMTKDQIMDGISIIDYTEFVDLVTQHDSVQSWL